MCKCMCLYICLFWKQVKVQSYVSGGLTPPIYLSPDEEIAATYIVSYTSHSNKSFIMLGKRSWLCNKVAPRMLLLNWLGDFQQATVHLHYWERGEWFWSYFSLMTLKLWNQIKIAVVSYQVKTKSVVVFSYIEILSYELLENQHIRHVS